MGFKIYSAPLNIDFFSSSVKADVTCFVLVVGGHAVEAGHGSELRHLSSAQLPICVSAAEDR